MTPARTPKSPAMPVAGELVRLSPLVRRLTQDNPSMFTAVGTNTHLIGERRVFILDPGPESDAHFDRILDAVGHAVVAAVIPTHHHLDHWPLAPRLAAHFGAPTLGFAACGDYVPQRTVADGEVLDSGETRMRAIHTPGHAPDHLCYLLDDGTLMSGDHVMGWSTSVIAPPGGNLNDYMASLGKLAALELRVMYPAHGFAIADPAARIEELRVHREQRTRQAIEALDAGLATIPAMVERIYADVDRKLHGAAARSLLAHLDALVEQGRVRVTRSSADPLAVEYALIR
jgi:glyoxylase-like metal-dependent hydrolase (beta-lactamase superfamily II)